MDELRQGARIVLGTPATGLSPGDPILEVIATARKEGIPSTVIGIASGWLRALALSGMPSVPVSLRRGDLTRAAWSEELATLALRRSTLVLPVRGRDLRSRVSALARAGQGQIFALRDPGGRREEGFRGEAASLAEELPFRGDTRASWFLVAAPAGSEDAVGAVAAASSVGTADPAELAHESPVPISLFENLLKEGVPTKTLARAATESFGGSYRKAYRFLLQLRKD